MVSLDVSLLTVSADASLLTVAVLVVLLSVGVIVIGFLVLSIADTDVLILEFEVEEVTVFSDTVISGVFPDWFEILTGFALSRI